MRCTHLIKFLLVIRGTLMAAPSKLLPVMKIPLTKTNEVVLAEYYRNTEVSAIHGLFRESFWQVQRLTRLLLRPKGRHKALFPDWTRSTVKCS